MFGNHPPKNTGIRCSNRFSSEKNGGATLKERRIYNVGMSDDPPHIGCSPVDIPGIYTIDRFHRPFQGHGMTTVVPNHTFGSSGCTGSVKNVKRIGGGQRYAVVGFCVCHCIAPVQIPPLDQTSGFHRSLQDDAAVGFCNRNIDGFIQESFVRDNLCRFYPTGG